MSNLAVILFLGMGTQEIMLILLIVLVLFGAKKIPDLARGFGRGIREFKDASREIKSELEDGINNENPKKIS